MNKNSLFQSNFIKRIKDSKQAAYSLLAFLLPVLVMMLICRARGMYPFGNESWLICDMDNQYVSYFFYFTSAVKEHGFFYTFSKTLGGDMLGFTAYYLMSPFNFLFLLFGIKEIPGLVAWISMAKLGLCGLSFYTLANYEGKRFGNLIFSSAYALMSYTLFYISNIMWFDAIYALPIVILGIKKLINEKKPFLYIASLAYTLLTSYYIGYMICIFCVLYYLYYLLCVNGEKLRSKWKNALIFSVSSLLAGGMNMWLLLPTKYSLEGVKNPFRWSDLLMEPNFFWNDILVKLLPKSSESLMTGMPNIYCGILILFFAGVFFLNSKIPLKRKAGTLLLYIIFFFSFYLKGIDLMWHGFSTPMWFPFRYSFLFCFLLICTAKEGFASCQEMGTKNRITASLLTLLAICAVIALMYRKPFSFMTKDAYTDGFIFALASLIVFLLNRKKTARIAALSGLALILLELGDNGADIYENPEGMPAVYYNLYADQAGPQTDLISRLDQGFYRMEKNFYRTMNDAMWLNYAGLGHYSSTEKPQIKSFMQAAGYRNNGNWVLYNRGSTLSMDSFLGVKYLLSGSELEAPYVFVDKIDCTGIYENPYAFSMAFLTDGNLADISTDYNSDKFALQNELLGAACCEDDIFIRQQDYDVSTQNLEMIDPRGVYQKIDFGAEAYIEYSFTVSSENPLYLYLNTDNMKMAHIYLNGVDAGLYFHTRQYDILSLDDYIRLNPGEMLTIRVELCENTISITDVQIYYEDTAALEACYEYQKEGAIRLEKFTDSHLEASFENPEGRSHIFFSIPYDTGWQIYLDGKKTAASVRAGIFLTVSDVSAGEHTIELRFVPRGFVPGFVISLICLIAVLTWYIFLCRKNNDRLNVKNTVKCGLITVAVCIIYLICLLFLKKAHDVRTKDTSAPYNPEADCRETFFMGQFEQDNHPENGTEPIEWVVLAVEDQKALVISRYALAYLPYASGSPTATWDTSYVREWLNHDFYENAFSDEEKRQILLSFLDNTPDASKYIDAGSNTEDYIFLPDRDDIIRYYHISAEMGENQFYSEQAICEPTAGAAALCKSSYTLTRQMYDAVYQGYGYHEDIVGTNGGEWWIRNPGLYTPMNALTVGGNGSVYDLGNNVSHYAFVRPAMWILLEDGDIPKNEDILENNIP